MCADRISVGSLNPMPCLQAVSLHRKQPVGDAEFFAALRAYLDDHRFGMTTTRELLDHIEAWNGADLLPIYRAYLSEYDTTRNRAVPWRIKRSVLEAADP
jgi:hypothetical protein